MSLQDVIRGVMFRAEAVRVRNAFNPILWGCAVATPTCFLFSAILRDDLILRYGFAVVGALPVLTLVGAYLYFMLRDPDRLQSEEFITRQQELLLLERKGLPPVSRDSDLSEDISATSSNEE